MKDSFLLNNIFVFNDYIIYYYLDNENKKQVEKIKKTTDVKDYDKLIEFVKSDKLKNNTEIKYIDRKYSEFDLLDELFFNRNLFLFFTNIMELDDVISNLLSEGYIDKEKAEYLSDKFAPAKKDEMQNIYIVFINGKLQWVTNEYNIVLDGLKVVYGEDLKDVNAILVSYDIDRQFRSYF